MPANLENSTVGTGLEKVSVHSSPNRGNAKECLNYCTIALISQDSKVMLKILQARLQQYVNWEYPDVQTGFRKGRRIRDQIVNIHWIGDAIQPALPLLSSSPPAFNLSTKQKWMFFWNSLAFLMIQRMLAISVANKHISGSSVFSKSSLNIWKFLVHVLLKPSLRILNITSLACEMSAIVQ